MQAIAEVGTVWGKLEEEEEEDNKIAQIEDYPLDESPSTRVRFRKLRTVVRYPSEQSLQASDEEVIADGQARSNGDEMGGGENEDKEKRGEQEKIENHVNGASSNKTIGVSNGSSNNTHESNDTSNGKPTPSRTWFQRVQVQRYTPRFAPPPPQEEANNGEDEEEESDEYEEEEEEDGYNSVVEEESGSEPEEDPIKKIAEESLASRKSKLQEVASEQEKILKDVAQIKSQLRDELDKAEQASKAAAEAAAKAEEENKLLSSRVTSMRSLLAMLCGCGVRIVGMLVAARLLDTTASHMQVRRTTTTIPSSTSLSLLPTLLSLPLSPHLAVAAGVSLTHTLLRHFRPSMRWSWLVSVDSAVGALVAVCAAALGGAKGGILGQAMVAGCIVGIIASSSSFSLSSSSTTRDKRQ